MRGYVTIVCQPIEIEQGKHKYGGIQVHIRDHLY